MRSLPTSVRRPFQRGYIIGVPGNDGLQGMDAAIHTAQFFGRCHMFQKCRVSLCQYADLLWNIVLKQKLKAIRLSLHISDTLFHIGKLVLHAAETVFHGFKAFIHAIKADV